MKKQFTENKQVNFSKVRSFKFETEQPSKLLIKHFLNKKFKTVSIGRTGQKLNKLMNLNMLGNNCNEPIRFNPKQLSNLKRLLPLIPLVYNS